MITSALVLNLSAMNRVNSENFLALNFGYFRSEISKIVILVNSGIYLRISNIQNSTLNMIFWIFLNLKKHEKHNKGEFLIFQIKNKVPALTLTMIFMTFDTNIKKWKFPENPENHI